MAPKSPSPALVRPWSGPRPGGSDGGALQGRRAGSYLSPVAARGPAVMSGALKLEFAPFSTSPKEVLVLFCEEGVKLGSAARKAIEPTGDLVTRAAAADR